MLGKSLSSCLNFFFLDLKPEMKSMRTALNVSTRSSVPCFLLCLHIRIFSRQHTAVLHSNTLLTTSFQELTAW
jgi:hypothetical protein